MTDELIKSLHTGDLTLPEYLAQVEARFNEREPAVFAFIPEESRFARLQKEADELVAKYTDIITRPPLFGMTVGVKDIFHVDGFTTQAGSQLPTGDLQGQQAASVTKLKDAGALIIGKTVTTEFAYFTPGLTRNPHHQDHTPGGSSSGSAAAVGAGICDITLGTQTIGSIIRPASFCGIVGVKPTYERISREGVIPLSPTFDHIGFFIPNVSAAKYVAPILYNDWKDSISIDKKPILGIPDGTYLLSASKYALACFNSSCDSLTRAGYELRRVHIMEDFQEIRNRHDLIMSYDAAQVHKNWFVKHENLYSTKFVDLIKRGQKVTDEQYQTAIKSREAFRNQITQTMNEHNIDLWICPPTIDVAPKGLESTGDPVMCLPWTQIGFPAINIPTIKNDEDLPMGLQLVGKWNADELLLAWAEDIEKVVRKI